MNKILNEIKAVFVLSCAKCGNRFDKEMKVKWNAGYNVTCNNCGAYIESVSN